MRFIAALLNAVTIYRLMLYFLSVLVGASVVLSAFGVLPYRAWDIVLQTIAFGAICWGLNALLARAAKTKPNFESPLITALILSLIAGPLSLPGEWYVLVVMAGAAMVSKYSTPPFLPEESSCRAAKQHQEITAPNRLRKRSITNEIAEFS